MRKIEMGLWWHDKNTAASASGNRGDLVEIIKKHGKNNLFYR